MINNLGGYTRLDKGTHNALCVGGNSGLTWEVSLGELGHIEQPTRYAKDVADTGSWDEELVE